MLTFADDCLVDFRGIGKEVWVSRDNVKCGFCNWGHHDGAFIIKAVGCSAVKMQNLLPLF
eukprot:3932023-Rhodomonas_salina.1